MNTQIFEATGPLTGLPKHWITYLANRWGKGSYYAELAGEHSIVTPIKQFDPGKIRKALKNPDNLAVIGKVESEPLFMITKHRSQTTKFSIFEVTPGEGYYDTKGTRTYRRRGRSSTHDAFNINEVVDIIDQMFQKEGKDFTGLTIEAISKDPEREEIVKKRREYAKAPGDPLYRPPEGYSWREPDPTQAQKERAKKYAELKRPILDAKIDTEVKKIKDQMGDILDKALENMIKNVKQGNTYSVNKTNLASEIARAIDTSGIERLAQAYSTIKTDYSVKHPTIMAKELKRTGLLQ